MERGKMERAGELAAWAVGKLSPIVQFVTGEAPDVDNPYKIAATKGKAVETKANSDKRRFWGGLEVALFGKVVNER